MLFHLMFKRTNDDGVQIPYVTEAEEVADAVEHVRNLKVSDPDGLGADFDRLYGAWPVESHSTILPVPYDVVYVS